MTVSKHWLGSIGMVFGLMLGVATPGIGVLAETAGNAPSELFVGERLPTGQRITPTAAPGSILHTLNPNLPGLPDHLAGHASAMAMSPDGHWLLVMTSGYNRISGANGKPVPELSNEYVFIYDLSTKALAKHQVLQVPNTFLGLAWAPDSKNFFVSGGVDDKVYRYLLGARGKFAASGEIKLGHSTGNGIDAKPMVASLATSPAGNRLLVANYQNDSVSLVDLSSNKVLAELDLRPGKLDQTSAGKPGGSYPYAVAFASDGKAYVDSQRDREIIVLDVAGDRLNVKQRIATKGQPNAMLLNSARNRLFVTADNTDSVMVFDTEDDRLLAEIQTLAPPAIFENHLGLRGASPNNLALSPDQRTLFVSNGGMNSVTVAQLGADALGEDALLKTAAIDGDKDDDEKAEQQRTQVLGLIPTAWYPNAVAVASDGRRLLIANGKSNPGPNPAGCIDSLSHDEAVQNKCSLQGQYILQMQKAGLLEIPMPNAAGLASLTWQVAGNNNWPKAAQLQRNHDVMEFLRQNIRHVVYIVKENRTYDQVLGDLKLGNGDPNLTLFPEPITPNHHAMATQFVTLDNFYDSGEISATGWNWTVAARTTDFTEKTSPVNYADRGLQYDWQGVNRGINVGLPTLKERIAANPATPNDPDIVPGTADIAAPDSSAGEAGTGYLWDAALKAGLTIRNYGFYGDDSRNYIEGAGGIPPTREPFKDKVQVFYSTKEALTPHSDPYYATYDNRVPDFWRFKEWEREFNQQVADDSFPRLTFLYFPHDHFGSFDKAIDGVNTIETQMADNDYATGKAIETIAKSRYGKDTLIFVIEDDPQDGPDHVSAYRSIGFVVGPYVKQGAVVSEHYTTVSMVRTIEEVLGLAPLGLHDAMAQPMSKVFDPAQTSWSFTAKLPEVLRTTQLPLPPKQQGSLDFNWGTCFTKPLHDAAYWTNVMQGQNFVVHDQLDTPRFNEALWRGLKGEDAPLPTRHGRDLSEGREFLLAAFRKGLGCP